MNSTKRLTALAAGLLVIGSLIAVPQAASAASGSVVPTALVVRAAAAPTCLSVKTDHDWAGFPRATVKNNCASTKRVKVVWAFAPDSACMTIGSGKTKHHTTGMLGRFDGLKTC